MNHLFIYLFIYCVAVKLDQSLLNVIGQTEDKKGRRQGGQTLAFRYTAGFASPKWLNLSIATIISEKP